MDKKEISKYNNEKAKELLIDISCVVCLLCTIIFLIVASNQYYQTLKDIEYAKALFMFSLFLTITQRVKLWNWKSFVATLLIIPVGYVYRNRFIESPDLFNRDKIVPWIIWMLLLIVIDMLVYKKVNNFRKINKIPLLIYGLTTITLIFYRNGSKSPLLLLVMIILFFIPLNEQGWNRLLNQLSCAWIIAFYWVLLYSLKSYPEVSEVNGRWYGCFMTLSVFGIFILGVTTILIYKIYDLISNNKQKTIEFFFLIGTCIPLVWVICRVSTLTMFAGLGAVLCVVFVFARKEINKQKIKKRVLILLVCGVVGGVGGLLLIRLLAEHYDSYWRGVLMEGNALLKPIAEIAKRGYVLFGEGAAANKIEGFEEGSLLYALNILSSGRIIIAKEFLRNCSFEGNGGALIEINDYVALHAHNGFIQLAHQHGIIAGLLVLLGTFSAFCAFVRAYMKKNQYMIIGLLWIAGTSVVMMAETIDIYSPTILVLLMLLCPIVVNLGGKTDEEREFKNSDQ